MSDFNEDNTITFSCTMDTYGNMKMTSFLLSIICCNISISATSVFPPLVGSEYIKLLPDTTL